MRTLLSLLVVSPALLLAGCFIPSANPLYNDESAVLKDSLPGDYKQENQVGTIEKGDGKFYWFVKKGDKVKKVKLTLVKLGDEYFTDVEMPLPDKSKSQPPLKVMHMINRVVFDGDKVKLMAFKDDKKLEQMPDLKLQDYTVTEADADGKEKPSTQKLVVMSPKDLQKFVQAHAAEMTEVVTTYEKVKK